MVFPAMFGCAGSKDDEDPPDALGAVSGWSFGAQTNLNGNCDTLTISEADNKSFPAGTQVNFLPLSGGAPINGDTSGVAGTSLFAGFPANAASGDYDVVVTTPGGAPIHVGNIHYTAGTCK
jgi:hypothetical protein